MGKVTRKEGDPIVYKKTIEGSLRTWVDVPVDQCRWDIADEYFDNPLGRKFPTGECSRIAIASTSNNNPPPPATATHMPSTAAAADAVVDQPVDRLDPANWADEHLKWARKLLEDWRNQTWLSRYKSQPFGAQGILPDSVLTSLASCTSFHTLNDVRDLRWVLAKQHAGEVLALLKNLDQELALEEIAKEQAQLEKEAESERETEKARKAAEKEADKVRKAAETVEEQAAEKRRKAEEWEVEKGKKKSSKTTGRKQKAKDEKRGEQLA
ncbi:hypothetical protein V8D89_011464 [Ganoderma adspersum]